jgi:hypothetical protein
MHLANKDQGGKPGKAQRSNHVGLKPFSSLEQARLGRTNDFGSGSIIGGYFKEAAGFFHVGYRDPILHWVGDEAPAG